MSLPSPVEDGFSKLLDACFAGEEFVAIAPAREDEAGEIVPSRGVTMTREEWKARVVTRGGIEKCFSTTLGLFVRINPMAKNGAKNEHVTSFRHALVEFDRDDSGTPIPKEQQHAAILASGLPVSAVIDSGNKSLHAWVRVDAPDGQAVHAWKKIEGAPKPAASGLHEVGEWREFMRQHGLKGGDPAPDVQQALKARKLLAEVEERELRLAVKRGEFITVEEVRVTWTNLVGQATALLRRKFENELPPILSGLDATGIQEECRKAIDEVLSVLHAG